MNVTEAVVTAAVSAGVATGVTLVVNKLQQAKDARAIAAECLAHQQAAHTQGYYEGRESILQSFGNNVKPEDFVPAQ